MHKLRMTFGSIAITAVMLLGLSTIVLWNEQAIRDQSEVAVFTSKDKRVHLENEHLVDQLATISHELPLHRVVWDDQGRLVLDLRVAASVHNQTILYEELYRWLTFSFQETDNVERLQLRIVIADKMLDKKYVLLAIDARRGTIPEESLEELIDGNAALSAQTVSLLRMTYTPLWQQLFPSRI